MQLADRSFSAVAPRNEGQLIELQEWDESLESSRSQPIVPDAR